MSFLQKKGRFLTGADGGQRVSGRVLRKKRERGMPSVNTSAVADQPPSSTPSPRTARAPGTPTPSSRFELELAHRGTPRGASRDGRDVLLPVARAVQ